ncbi:MAG: transposase [Methylococcaceae bacterium]|nr:transposase [Methylococcaceae bacterium]
MGRSRYRICDEKAPHFLTCTVLNWMPLFTRPQTAGIILDALRYRQEETGWKIYGYVILENHIHLIVQAENLAMELPRFKSYTARKLIDHLKECHAERLLKQLAFFRKSHKQDRDYQCWEEGSHPQLIENEQVLRQKLDYIARDYAGLAGLVTVYKDWL